jgi:hypothetical protein
MKNSKKRSLRPDDSQTRFTHKLKRPSVPVTAERLRKLIGVAVLPATQPVAIAATMFQ